MHQCTRAPSSSIHPTASADTEDVRLAAGLWCCAVWAVIRSTHEPQIAGPRAAQMAEAATVINKLTVLELSVSVQY